MPLGSHEIHRHESTDKRERNISNPQTSWTTRLGGPAGLLGGLDGGVVNLLLLGVLGNSSVVLGNGLLLSLSPPLLEGSEVSLPLETQGGDKTLDLGRLSGSLAILLGNLSSDDKLGNVILLGQVEELADLGGTLRTKSLGENDIGKTGELIGTLLDNGDGEDTNVIADNAATDRLPLPLTVTTGSVTRVAVGKEEPGSVLEKDTLLHGETLQIGRAHV